MSFSRFYFSTGTKSRSSALFVAALLAVGLCLSSCGGKKHSVRSSHKRHPETAVHVDWGKLDKTRRSIVEEAMTWIDTPYRYAGEEKGRGTDCSGMVMRVFDDLGICKLPRNSAKQAEYCRKLKPKDVRPGDLVFFATGKDPGRVSHVGIMIDEVNFIHASTSKGVVVSRVDTPYYIRTFMMYGRPPVL